MSQVPPDGRPPSPSGRPWQAPGALGGDLVSGEAVVLELRLAKFPSRSVGIAIDIAVQLALLWALFLLLGALLSGGDDAAGTALTLLVVVAVIVGYPLLFETLTRGRSLGKLAMGLRVVREDGGSVRFRHSLVRALVGVLEIWLTFGVVAILVSLTSSRGKRVGDFAAGTVVLRERVPDLAGPMAQMPPAMAPWAGAADLSRLPDALALAARQFLSRTGALDAGVRYSMGRQLAFDVARYVTPLPPPQCPPEAYLAAVVAERRRRELLRTSVAVQPQPHSPLPPSARRAPPAPAVAPPGALEEQRRHEQRPDDQAAGGGFVAPQ